VLDEVADEVAPYVLPADLRRFWELVEPARIAVTPFPALVDARSALSLRRSNLDPEIGYPPPVPPLLLPIAYSSHAFRSIEIGSQWSEGGTIFTWAHDDERIAISHHRLGDLLDVLAELVTEGNIEHRGGYALLSFEDEVRKGEARLSEAGPHVLYGANRDFPKWDLRAWPAHWLESLQIDLRSREPLGSTHTIAALVVEAERGPVRGRIAGLVTRLVGVGGGVLVLVDDGTRELDVWCPPETTVWGPGHGLRYEFEVTIDGPVPAPLDFDTGHAELQRHALAGRVEESFAAAEAFLGRFQRHRAPAVASDVRPLDS
jgi:hypothetical protein